MDPPDTARPRVSGDLGWQQSTVLGVGLLGFALAWWLLANGHLYGSSFISDTPIYVRFFDEIVRGGLPYRDLTFEYPPAALPAIMAPLLFGVGVGDLDGYTAAFELVMLGCGLATIVCVWISLLALRASRLHLVLGLGLLAVSPLLLGPLVLSRFDLWPVALTAAAMAATLRGHDRIGAAGLGLATMAKVYPVMVLPVLLIHVWRNRGRAEAVRCVLVAVAVMALILVPFAIVAPDGIADSLARQLGRPLQVESLGAALLFAYDTWQGVAVVIGSSAGSQNLVGVVPDAAAIGSTLIQVAAILGVWAWFARGRADRNHFVRAAAASVVAYVAFGKVLSPQYVIWLAPLVVLVGGRRGALAAGILIAALFWTVSYFPSRYFDLIDHLDGGVIGLLVARDLALIALFGALVLPLRAIQAATARAGHRVRDVARSMGPGQVLIVILVAAVLLRLVWLTLPNGSLIFDEAYYVNAARAILGWDIPSGASYAGSPVGLDPNSEHPPLGKVLIAGSMLVFGDNGIGWRLPSVVAGIIALVAVYAIVRTTGRSRWLGVLTVFILSLDPLTFIHARIGVLDMFALAAILVGSWLGLTHRSALAGIAFAVGCLFKVTAVFGLLAYLVLVAIPLVERSRHGERLGARDVREPVIALGVAALVGLGGLWLLDLRFTEFTSPLDHIAHMLRYGIALTGTPQPSGISSDPWVWLVNGGGFDYLRIDVSALVDGKVVDSHPSVLFRAAMNPVLLGSIWLAIPFGIVRAVRAGDRLAQWALVWLSANYVPFFVLVLLTHRITYLYYALPVVPALAELTALLLLRARLPPFVRWAYLAALVVGFIAYFPFRQLP